MTQQDQYLHYIGQDTTKNQSVSAIKAIIKQYWDYKYEILILRNSHQHDKNDAPFNFKKLQLLQEIKEL